MKFSKYIYIYFKKAGLRECLCGKDLMSSEDNNIHVSFVSPPPLCHLAHEKTQGEKLAPS